MLFYLYGGVARLMHQPRSARIKIPRRTLRTREKFRFLVRRALRARRVKRAAPAARPFAGGCGHTVLRR